METPTQKKRKRFRWAAVVAAMAVGVVFAIAAAAIADNTEVIGDDVTTVSEVTTLAVGSVACGQAKVSDVSLVIRRTGSGTNVFKNGAPVSISVQSTTGVTAAIGADTTLALPSNWEGQPNNTLSSAFTDGSVAATITVNSTTAGPGAGSVTFRATGPNGSNVTITRDVSLPVTWTTGSCVVPDTTPPSNGSVTINDGAAWTNSTAATVDLSATDAVGVTSYRLAQTQADLAAATPVSVSPAATTFAANNVAFSLSAGDGTKAAWVRICDAAGNCSDASDTIGLDTVKPTITGSTGSYVPGTWTNQNVTVSFTCADNAGGSGIATSTVAGAIKTDNGADQSVTNSGTCVDNAGNIAESATVGNIDIDKLAPTITDLGPTTASNAAGWYKTDVVNRFKAADGLSGLNAACLTAFPDVSGERIQSKTTSGEGEDLTVTSDSCTDAAGNTSNGVQSFAFDVDKTAPVVAVTGVANGQTYIYGAVPQAGCSTSDALSGVKTSATIGTSGGPLGSVTVTCTGAEDNAGNTSSASATYTVRFGVCLLYDPAKSHKAGSTVPIKLFLCDASGANVSSANVVVTAWSLNKIDNSAAGTLEDSGYANPDSNFRFDPTLSAAGGYIFNLSTKSPSPALGQKNALGTGTWKLTFRVDGLTDPAYEVRFDVK